ncbi:MFS transporter [Streptomyces sp. TLI_171]|uniref:MFS transporter n=1 Tax=Streptomyces sp. TLI_171 TaxID=1938859 RepID=UPI000C60B0B0|nr:MFS transporter [Streptomyces sp. TLI_171]RKE20688.1 putative MFS family arabinose efflux permease [Streptomyces sp. TLI_171]
MTAPELKTASTPRVGTGAGPAIWSGNFRLYFTARSAGLLSDAMLPVAVTTGLLTSHHAGSTVGYAMAFLLAPFAGLVLVGGVLADRFTARRLMIFADLLNLVTRVLLAVLFFRGIDQLWQLYLLLALAGTAAAMFQPGAASTVPLVARDVQGANGILRTSEALTTLAGPPLAGLLAAASTGWVMVIAGAMYAISASCLLTLRLGPVPAPPPGDSLWRNLVEGWHEFWSRSWMWGVILIWMVFTVLSWGPLNPLIGNLVVPKFGGSVYGVLNGMFGAGTVIGGLAAIRLKPARPLTAGALALLAFPVQQFAFVFDLPWPVLGAAQLVSGIGISFWGVMWATSVQTQVPGEVLNRIHAYEVAGSVCMFPIGAALSGPAKEAFGAQAMLLVGGTVTLLTVAVLLLSPPIRNLRRVDTAGPVAAGH